MAFQLVYTSAAKLLDAGRSGYGTVARSKSITPLVVSAVERVSQFANMRGLDRSRVIHVHRRITAGSNRFHILTRIVDAGADYTGRTNHLAHHLVISQEEAARAAARGITPADVLRQFQWLERWDGNARFFDASGDVPLESFRPDGMNSGRQFWSSVTGNPAHARLLSWDGAPRTGVLVVPEAMDTLQLLAEALVEFGPQSWTRSFTTSLETTDELSELEWIVSTPSAFHEIQPRCGSRTLFDLTKPATLPTPPIPAAAAPQVAAARHNAPDTHESEAAITITCQSAADPVKVSIAPSGSRAAGTSSRRSNPKEDKKTQIKLLVGFAALLLVAGIFAFAILKDTATDKQEQKPVVAKDSLKLNLTSKQEVQFDKLCKVLKDGAKEKFIITSGDDWEKWTAFILDSENMISEIQKQEKTADSKINFPDLPQGDDPIKLPQWAKDLQKLVKNLKTLNEVEENSWIKQFDDACKNIDDLNADGSMLILAADNEKLKNELFRRFAEQRLDEVLKMPSDGKLSELLDAPDPWKTKKYPERRDQIITKIKKSIDQFSEDDSRLEALSAVIQANEDFFGSGDKGIKKSLAEKLEKSPAPSETKPVAAVKSKSNSSPLAEDKTPKSQNRQIIIASESELKSGIPVELLKEIMDAKIGSSNPESIKIIAAEKEGIKIIAGKNEEEIGTLTFTKGKFFSKTWEGTAPEQFFPDGKFISLRDDIDSIQFSYPNKLTWIVADKKLITPLESELIFTPRVINEDEAVIDGEKLIKSINEIKNIEQQSKNLVFQLKPLNSNFTVHQKGKEWSLVRPAQVKPDLIFSESDAEEIRKAKDGYIKVTRGDADLKSETNQKSEDIKKSFAALKDHLTKAVGGGLLRHDLKLESDKSFSESHWKSVQEVFVDKYGGAKERAKYDDWEKDIADIQKKIGENKFDVEWLKLDPKFKWEKPEGKSIDSVVACIDSVLKKTAKPEPRKPLKEEIKTVESLSVQTKRGRVLFHAKKEEASPTP